MGMTWQRLSVLLALVAAAVALLYRRYWWYIPGLLSHFTIHVQPKRPSLWEAQLAAGVPPARSQESARAKPNVIFIVADDLGYNDISFYGGGLPGLRTPHIDSIGARGAAFSAGYAGHATCAPSRAAIMTGEPCSAVQHCTAFITLVVCGEYRIQIYTIYNIFFAMAMLCLHCPPVAITGRYATRFGFEFTPVPLVMSKVLGGPDPLHPNNQPLHSNHYFKERERDVPPVADMAFPASERTIAEHMTDAGYHNMLVGKWVSYSS
jgi:arylsulfatase A-like enzyme